MLIRSWEKREDILKNNGDSMTARSGLYTKTKCSWGWKGKK